MAKGTLCATSRSFNLQAATRVAANDKPGRERLGRHIFRPPLANDRLSLLEHGRRVGISSAIFASPHRSSGVR
jgi:hypothetical protein